MTDTTEGIEPSRLYVKSDLGTTKGELITLEEEIERMLNDGRLS